jgi:hypothetical protein
MGNRSTIDPHLSILRNFSEELETYLRIPSKILPLDL